MKTLGIIAEYNPFHNGHKFHIEQARRQSGADAVVVVMSGNFVQRGEPAIFERSVRAAATIAGGADLVIELPAVCAAVSAEIFARNSVFLMDALGCVDYLAFGAESEELSDIRAVAKFLITEYSEFDNTIRAALKSGISYAAAREFAVGELLGEKYAEILRKPNNILGVEYLKAIYRFGSEIEPILVRRKLVRHDELEARGAFASASYIRELIKTQGLQSVETLVPPECMEIYRSTDIHKFEHAEVAVLANLRRMGAGGIANLPDVSEGLENRIFEFANKCGTLEELIDSVQTRRYTYARTRRIMLHSYLGIEKKDLKLPQYLRILDFSERGREILNSVKKTTKLPLAKNFSQLKKSGDEGAISAWERELVFDSLYGLCKTFKGVKV